MELGSVSCQYSKMRHQANTILAWLRAFGVEPLETVAAFRALPAVVRDYRRFCRVLTKEQAAAWPVRFEMPCLLDRRADSGTAKGHYFHQDLWVARRIYERNPERHIDVGSSVAGLVAHLAVFREVEVLDIRPQPAVIQNVTFRQHDVMGPVGEFATCCDSLLCLHALEHFGLGRYGDPIDPDGYRRGFEALAHMLRPGGRFYFSVPVGKCQRVGFNGHRVFAVPTILDLAAEALTLTGFAWVDDAGMLHEDCPASEAHIPDDVRYGCGIFELCRNVGPKINKVV